MTKILRAPANAQQIPHEPPRERILTAARELFYSRGIRQVSVDDIAAAAGTNKMTLYRHFDSKDLLIAEYVRSLAADGDRIWQEIGSAHPNDPLGQLRAWVERTGEMLATSGDRGCAVANAAVEIPEKDHPARAVIEEHKTHQRDNLVRVCRESGFEDPEGIADEIFLMLEGARINVQSVGQSGPGSRFRDMACALIRTRARREPKRSR
jgi:AcrR family transcriptional regulator